MTPIREYLLALGVERTASHEAGHMLTCHSFELVSEFKLWTEEGGNWARVNPVRGACAYGPKSRLTPWIEACIGWGGIVGEVVAGFHGSGIDQAEFRRMADQDLGKLTNSQTDLAAILKEPDRWRTAEKTFEIVTAHREALELAIQKARRDMLENRRSLVRPGDVGLKPHRIFTAEVS